MITLKFFSIAFFVLSLCQGFIIYRSKPVIKVKSLPIMNDPIQSIWGIAWIGITLKAEDMFTFESVTVCFLSAVAGIYGGYWLRYKFSEPKLQEVMTETWAEFMFSLLQGIKHLGKILKNWYIYSTPR